MTEVQLDAQELHAVARDKDAATPQPFRSTMTKLARTEREYKHALWERDDLIREARKIGVPWTALARWTGVSERRLFQIIEEDR